MKCGILLAFCLAATAAAWSAPQNPAPAASAQQTPRSGAATASSQPPPAAQYTLTPEKRAQAIAYSRARYVLYFVGFALSILIYFFFWRARIAEHFRDWARRASRSHFVQSLIFAPLFLVAASALNFPVDWYSDFVLERRFGLSTQGFGSWLGDWGKSVAIGVVMGVFLVWVFYAVVRRSPRRWWLHFWLSSIPIVILVTLAEPYVVEPLFFKFTPLEATEPALANRIEAMLKHSGLSIPRSRIFEMDASTKTITLNAYVSGLGVSKRVVVWDTTLEKMTPDETLMVLGHELGHYVLHHIPKQIALDELIFLALSYFGFVAVNRIVERSGARTGIESVGDLASLPVVMLVLTIMVFLGSPAINGISRHYEHQADQFGLEVAYGVVPNPNAAEVRSLQVLGEVDLADPDPNPLIKFWLYTHPPLDERIRFAATYKPWAQGKPLELVRPRE